LPPGLSDTWSVEDSKRLYRIDDWGRGYFGVSKDGKLLVTPSLDASKSIDLDELIQGLRSRELTPPILVRFSEILEHRMGEFRSTFDTAIAAADYEGSYTLVYPIKVNQQRHVCEEIRDVGRELGFGLEVGSKPELLAALALTASAEGMPIYCNGFKDEEYLTLVILATKLGRRIVPIVKQFGELEILTQLAPRYDVRPTIGVRARLDASGVGRWDSSSGTRGKFGLSVPEILRAVEFLEARDMLDAFGVLHCHVGSQMHDIRAVKRAVTEMGRLYAELRRMGVPVHTVDVGGGMAVDYDGSRSARDSSMNYDLPEYAADVVFRLRDICNESGVPHPHIVSESGRAVVAYSSVLVLDVLGARAVRMEAPSRDELSNEELEYQPLKDLFDALDSIERADQDPVSAFHDAQHARDEAASLFSLGEMTLAVRARCETLFWSVAARMLERVPRPLPDDMAGLPELMADVYFCNFSLFQSLPDAWAIDQLFPILPLSRLNEKPERLATLADITCDSDGKVDRFIPGTTSKPVLELHALEADSAPYHLGVFLVGAYQETLGDLHNLLGDTHAVHVSADDNGGWRIEEVVEGDTVREVLGYVQFEPDEMRRTMRRDVELAIQSGRLSVAEGTALRRSYEEGLEGYTYME